jgi:hypothetical protein
VPALDVGRGNFLPVQDGLRKLIAGGMSQRKAAEFVGCKESTARLALSR